MELREYVLLLVGKVEQAGGRGDKAEVARLLRLLSDVALEHAVKLERDA